MYKIKDRIIDIKAIKLVEKEQNEVFLIKLDSHEWTKDQIGELEEFLTKHLNKPCKILVSDKIKITKIKHDEEE
jgi:hypothetical protein